MIRLDPSIPATRLQRIALSLLLAAMAPAFAATSDEIARIERGLRQPVALASQAATRTLADEMRRLNVPGVSIAVIRGGKIAWAQGFGVTHIGGPAVTADTLFQAASISKPVAAMAALRLAQEGKLDLDADVNTILTSWKLPPASTGEAKTSLRQLLSHTGGTSVSGFRGYAADQAVPTLVQVLDGAAPANSQPVRVEAAPGSTFSYSGGGYSIVQQALIDRAQQPFDALLANTVLKPIGMKDSSFAQPLPAALLARAALPHDATGKPYAGGPYTYPELAAAGLWTTPTDLARFAIDLQRSASGGKGVLSPSMARTMLQPVKKGYGLGTMVEGAGVASGFGHTGSNMGYQNTLFAYAGADKGGDGVVVMTNSANGGELAGAIVRAVAFEYKWPSRQPRLREAIALPEAAQDKLVGRYVARGLGEFTIERRDGRLMVTPPGGRIEPLHAESPTVLFVLAPDLELRMEGDGGRILAGSREVPFTRAQ
ncbi:serine hydrolase domain-containing protein [Massilia niabensis]|uniref:Serine hydrolase domain-containing protein n=1 Tax=Massilia niabensis TaxID=544910 RepID=A0ABW0L7Q0_9BURK